MPPALLVEPPPPSLPPPPLAAVVDVVDGGAAASSLHATIRSVAAPRSWRAPLPDPPPFGGREFLAPVTRERLSRRGQFIK
jgi:hypothetical protein